MMTVAVTLKCDVEGCDTQPLEGVSAVTVEGKLVSQAPTLQSGWRSTSDPMGTRRLYITCPKHSDQSKP